MLNQIIWTRCYPHRELLNRGQVTKADGFGVFSMSRELVEHPPVPSFDYLKNRLAHSNGAREESKVGLFNSYEYNQLGENVYVLSYVVARPHCKGIRKNGQTHRTRTFIKQSLIGNIENYPFEWFGAEAWTAAAIDEPDYYLEDSPDQEPDWLPQVSSKSSGGYITPQKIRSFVLDGRAECVKAGMWYLIDQYSKNESDRKVLIIKDLPENVELWVAAFEYGLSPQLARKVTFATNRSNIGTQADSALFYSTDPSGMFSPTNVRKENMTRHPYAMIVGIHPLDQFANIKAQPNSNFAMIDGKNKTTNITADHTVSNAYYNALVKYDDDIIDFSAEVLSSLPVDSISKSIPEMYDAYMYLLDSRHSSAHWEYNSAVKALQTLFAKGVSDSDAICGYLLNECMRIYQSFSSSDEKNNFSLLKIMWKLAVRLKRTPEVTGCLADCVVNSISKTRSDPDSIVHLWNAIQKGGVEPVIQTALPNIFNDDELPEMAKQMHYSTPETAEALMEMFVKMLAAEPEGISAIRTNNAKFNFAGNAVITSMKDRDILYKILGLLSKDDELMNKLALQISTHLENNSPSEVNDWWDTVIDISGGNVVNLCESICKTKNADIDMIENLLASRISRAGRCDDTLIKAYERATALLKNKTTTGIKFYSAWIDIAKVSELPDLISKLSKTDLSKTAKKELADKMDQKIYNVPNVSDTVYNKVNRFAENLGSYSRSAILHDFAKNLDRCRRANDAIDYAKELTKRKISMDNSLFTSELFESVTKAGAQISDGELHNRLMLLFVMDGKMLGRYVSAYITEIMEKAGRNLPEVIVSITEGAVGQYKISPYDERTVTSVQNVALETMKKRLPEYYKPSLNEKIGKIKISDKNAEKKLLQILDKMEKEYKSSNPMSNIIKGLGELFSKKGE